MNHDFQKNYNSKSFSHTAVIVARINKLLNKHFPAGRCFATFPYMSYWLKCIFLLTFLANMMPLPVIALMRQPAISGSSRDVSASVLVEDITTTYCRNDPVNNVDPLGLWNLWNPATWVDKNAAGWSWTDSLNPAHESSGYNKETVSLDKLGMRASEGAHGMIMAPVNAVEGAYNTVSGLGTYAGHLSVDPSGTWQKTVDTAKALPGQVPTILVNVASDPKAIGGMAGDVMMGAGFAKLGKLSKVGDLAKVEDVADINKVTAAAESGGIGKVRLSAVDNVMSSAMRVPSEPGFSDIVAHGTPKTIEYGAKAVDINHRAVARLIQNNSSYSGEAIRLLSCDTGSLPQGFAQGLADQLGVTIRAPNSALWVRPDGSYFIGPNPWTRTGKWVDFVPGGGTP